MYIRLQILVAWWWLWVWEADFCSFMYTHSTQRPPRAYTAPTQRPLQPT